MIVIIELVGVLLLFWFAWEQVLVPLFHGTPLFPMLRSSKERLMAKNLQAKLAAIREEEQNQALLDDFIQRREALEAHRQKHGGHQKEFDEQQNSL